MLPILVLVRSWHKGLLCCVKDLLIEPRGEGDVVAEPSDSGPLLEASSNHETALATTTVDAALANDLVGKSISYWNIPAFASENGCHVTA